MNNILYNSAGTIIIGSEGKGYEFSPDFVKYVLRLAFPNKILVFENSPKCDLVVLSHFTYIDRYWNKQSKPYLVWNGESISRYGSIIKKISSKASKILLISSVDEGGISISYGFHVYVTLNEHNLWLKYNKNILNRKRLFAYCISNHCSKSERALFIDKFAKMYNFTYSLGKYCHPKSIHERLEGKWGGHDEMLKQLSDTIFYLAGENTKENGYFTEKIIMALAAGCIPIYIGNSSYAKKIINSERMICVDDFETHEDCIQYILSMTQSQLEKCVAHNIFSNDSESEIFRELYNRNATCNQKIIKEIYDLLDTKSNTESYLHNLT